MAIPIAGLAASAAAHAAAGIGAYHATKLPEEPMTVEIVTINEFESAFKTSQPASQQVSQSLNQAPPIPIQFSSDIGGVKYTNPGIGNYDAGLKQLDYRINKPYEGNSGFSAMQMATSMQNMRSGTMHSPIRSKHPKYAAIALEEARTSYLGQVTENQRKEYNAFVAEQERRIAEKRAKDDAEWHTKNLLEQTKIELERFMESEINEINKISAKKEMQINEELAGLLFEVNVAETRTIQTIKANLRFAEGPIAAMKAEFQTAKTNIENLRLQKIKTINAERDTKIKDVQAKIVEKWNSAQIEAQIKEKQKKIDIIKQSPEYKSHEEFLEKIANEKIDNFMAATAPAITLDFIRAFIVDSVGLFISNLPHPIAKAAGYGIIVVDTCYEAYSMGGQVLQLQNTVDDIQMLKEYNLNSYAEELYEKDLYE